jgi:hypothetical protein
MTALVLAHRISDGVLDRGAVVFLRFFREFRGRDAGRAATAWAADTDGHRRTLTAVTKVGARNEPDFFWEQPLGQLLVVDRGLFLIQSTALAQRSCPQEMRPVRCPSAVPGRCPYPVVAAVPAEWEARHISPTDGSSRNSPKTFVGGSGENSGNARTAQQRAGHGQRHGHRDGLYGPLRARMASRLATSRE